MSKMENLPRAKNSAERFKQLSDDIWMYHSGGRESYAALPLELGFEEYSTFSETLASIDSSLVLVGPLAPRELRLKSTWGQEMVLDAHQLVSLERGTIETFNRDTSGTWYREINVRYDFHLAEGILTTEHNFKRDGMGVDRNVLLRASAHLSRQSENFDFEGEEMAFFVLNSENENAFLTTTAEMGRLSIAEYWRAQE